MGVRQVQQNLGAIAGPTDTLGNTGQLDIGPTSETIRSFTMFNNAANAQFLLIDLPNSTPVKIPASTSFDLTVADLMEDDLRKITILGKSGDAGSITYVTGKGRAIDALRDLRGHIPIVAAKR